MDEDPEFEVEMILKKKIKNGTVQYNVKWKGFPDSDNTWEPAEDLTCYDLISRFENGERPAVASAPVKKEDPDPRPPLKMLKMEGGRLVKEEKKPIIKTEVKPVIVKTEQAIVKKEEPVDVKPNITPDKKPPKRKLQTGKRSAPPRHPVSETARPPVRDLNAPVSMKGLDEPIVCKRPYGFELGDQPTAVIGFVLKERELYYLLQYGDREEWTPSEWAEKSEWGLARILIPYYQKVSDRALELMRQQQQQQSS
jgi:hypothetical protein